MKALKYKSKYLSYRDILNILQKEYCYLYKCDFEGNFSLASQGDYKADKDDKSIKIKPNVEELLVFHLFFKHCFICNFLSDFCSVRTDAMFTGFDNQDHMGIADGY